MDSNRVSFAINEFANVHGEFIVKGLNQFV